MLYIESVKRPTLPLSIVLPDYPTNHFFEVLDDRSLHQSLQEFILGKQEFGLTFLRRKPLDKDECPVEVMCHKAEITGTTHCGPQEELPGFQIRYGHGKDQKTASFPLQDPLDRKRFFRDYGHLANSETTFPAVVGTMRQGDLELILERRQKPHKRKPYGSSSWLHDCEKSQKILPVSLKPDIMELWDSLYLPMVDKSYQQSPTG